MEPAYVAGIIDGEGCVQFGSTRKSVFSRILVVNTNLELLEALQDAYGGDISEQKNAARRGWKRSYQWRLSNSRAVDLLEVIYPWLLVKRAQAETIFAWDACRRGRGRRFDPDALGLLKDQMTWLNRKGPFYGEEPVVAALGDVTCH